MLPFSWRGEVTLPRAAGSDLGQIVDRVAAALEELRPRVVRREVGAVVFKGGLFRLVSSWNLLVPISRGRVEAAQGPGGPTIRYRIAFTEVVVVVTCMVAWAAVQVTHIAGPGFAVRWSVVLALMWLWLVGGNVTLALVRFPAFLRRVGAGPGPGAAAEPVAAAGRGRGNEPHS